MRKKDEGRRETRNSSPKNTVIGGGFAFCTTLNWKDMELFYIYINFKIELIYI